MPRRSPNRKAGSGFRPREKSWSNLESQLHSTQAMSSSQAVEAGNVFTRHLTGFNAYAVELMLAAGLQFVDEAGFAPITFKGRTESPKKEIPYNKPTLLTHGRLVALTGLVSASNVEEIGHGSSAIQQVGAPILDEYSAPKRFNVTLGTPDTFTAQEARELRYALEGASLALSAVAAINGREVLPGRVDFESFWRRG